MMDFGGLFSGFGPGFFIGLLFGGGLFIGLPMIIIALFISLYYKKFWLSFLVMWLEGGIIALYSYFTNGDWAFILGYSIGFSVIACAFHFGILKIIIAFKKRYKGTEIF